MNTNPEALQLIATLHKAQQRLEELTAGEVDSVTNRAGRTSLLRQAQDRLRHSEATKRTAIAQLEATNKELETFSYSVSHDLRAPLRGIMGFVELLRKDATAELTAENLRHLAAISRLAEGMGILIEDLLAFSRTAGLPLRKTDVDTGQLAADVVNDFQAETIRRNIVWRIHTLPALRADRALLRMVLVNLISNAVKFTGARAEPRIEIGCEACEGAETAIFIRDNGAGFDPQYAARLFGAFQRLHSESEFVGTGIGLATVQRIIHRHGGRTWARGAVNEGATFYFSIPQSG